MSWQIFTVVILYRKSWNENRLIGSGSWESWLKLVTSLRQKWVCLKLISEMADQSDDWSRDIYLQNFSFWVFLKLQLLLIKRVECFSRQTSSSLQHTLSIIHQVHLHIWSYTHTQTHTHSVNRWKYFVRNKNRCVISDVLVHLLCSRTVVPFLHRFCYSSFKPYVFSGQHVHIVNLTGLIQMEMDCRFWAAESGPEESLTPQAQTLQSRWPTTPFHTSPQAIKQPYTPGLTRDHLSSATHIKVWWVNEWP